MARHRFQPGPSFPARFTSGKRRALENNSVLLLRLEFEVFSELLGLAGNSSGSKQLTSTGKIVCRDLVCGPSVDPTRDSGLMLFTNALRVPHPERPESWQRIQPRSRWVRIEFGGVDPADMRNHFASIRAFDPASYEVVEYNYDLDKQWVAPQEAANRLKMPISASTIRRRVKEFEAEHGSNLVRSTIGGHRRIYLPLLRNLLDH